MEPSTSKPAAPNPPKPVAPVKAKPDGHSPKRSFWIGVVITGLLIWCSHLIEDTTFGTWVGHVAFQYLNFQLKDDQVGSLPVVVINTSHLRPRLDSNFDRGKLLSLIQAVAKQRPAVIGVDVNYTLRSKEQLSSGDLHLIQECKKICLGPRPGGTNESAIPVFLGLENPVASPLWENPEFQEMASFISVQPDDVRRLARWIEFDDADGTHKAMPSMSQALADAYLKHQGFEVPAPGWLTRWAVVRQAKPFEEAKGLEVSGQLEQVAVDPNADPPLPKKLQVEKTLVNYQKAESIASETAQHLSELNAEDLPSSDRHVHLAGKMVILGDMDVDDNFAIASMRPPVRGALLHASAAYTFARSPVYELTAKARLMIDIIVSLIMVILVARCARLDEHRRYRTKTAIIFGVYFGVLALSYIFVNWLSILWLDLIPISLALFIHPYVEEAIDALMDWWINRKS